MEVIKIVTFSEACRAKLDLVGGGSWGRIAEHSSRSGGANQIKRDKKLNKTSPSLMSSQTNVSESACRLNASHFAGDANQPHDSHVRPQDAWRARRKQPETQREEILVQTYVCHMWHLNRMLLHYGAVFVTTKLSLGKFSSVKETYTCGLWAHFEQTIKDQRCPVYF